MHQIFVPSRGRAHTSKFLQMVHDSKETCTVVVEQEDRATYMAKFPQLSFLTLPESNMGITYVRNFIKKYAEDNSIYKHWMIDDDLSAFYIRLGARMVKTPFNEVLKKAEQQFGKGFGIAALDYQQLAWSATYDLIKDGYAEVCVLTDNTKTFGMRYRLEAEGKEDRDFAMQCIAAGYGTLRSTLYAFAAPANGSNSGGLKEIFYDIDQRENQCVESMISLWGNEVCYRQIKPNGRIDLKILWNKITAPKAINPFEL